MTITASTAPTTTAEFSELTPRQVNEARLIFSQLQSFSAFTYQINAKGEIVGRTPKNAE